MESDGYIQTGRGKIGHCCIPAGVGVCLEASISWLLNRGVPQHHLPNWPTLYHPKDFLPDFEIDFWDYIKTEWSLNGTL